MTTVDADAIAVSLLYRLAQAVEVAPVHEDVIPRIVTIPRLHNVHAVPFMFRATRHVHLRMYQCFKDNHSGVPTPRKYSWTNAGSSRSCHCRNTGLPSRRLISGWSSRYCTASSGSLKRGRSSRLIPGGRLSGPNSNGTNTARGIRKITTGAPIYTASASPTDTHRHPSLRTASSLSAN